MEVIGMEDTGMPVEGAEHAETHADESSGGIEGASDDLISKLIERYHEERLDRRDKGSPPGAGAAARRGLLAQMLYLN